MTTIAARRLVLTPQAVAETCARLGPQLPPAFAGSGASAAVDVHPSVEAGLQATCAPRVGVLVTTTLGTDAAFGIRADLGGSLLRTATSDVEVSAWPAARLGEELARAVPTLPCDQRPTLHLPLSEIAADPDLQALVAGTLRATVLAPPYVQGLVTWLATAAGWLALQPAEVREGVRWATVRPAEPVELGAAVASFVAAALA